MNEPLTPIQKIDAVLEFITSKYPAGENGLYFYKAAITILNKMQLTDKDMPPSEIEMILKKLLKDGYIDCTDDASKLSTSNWRDLQFYKTFEGEIFSADGGYQGKINRRNAENIRLGILEKTQRRHQSYMTWLTVILAAGTTLAAIYYCVELYWTHGWFHF